MRFPSAEGQFDLGDAIFEIQRWEPASCLLQLPNQSIDLALVHEQFALAQRGVAGVAAALYHRLQLTDRFALWSMP